MPMTRGPVAPWTAPPVGDKTPGLPFRRVEVDIVKGETRTPAFLPLNPNRRIRAWLERVAAQPGHVPISAPVGIPLRWP